MVDLTQYNQQFIDNLGDQLAVYTIMGSSKSESPMWFQLADHRDIGHLKFKSSQNSHMFFSFPVHEHVRFMKWDDIYDHFKQLKYSHIAENWPTVYNEINR